jgi:hypothetical protein
MPAKTSRDAKDFSTDQHEPGNTTHEWNTPDSLSDEERAHTRGSRGKVPLQDAKDLKASVQHSRDSFVP